MATDLTATACSVQPRVPENPLPTPPQIMFVDVKAPPPPLDDIPTALSSATTS